MKYLTLCMNFKNEAPYLKEWIDYHLFIGVEHFYLFDNDSTDESLQVLKPYKDKGLITLHKSNKNPIKPAVYEYVLNNYDKDSKWIGFIDCDEFVVPTKHDNVKECFSLFDNYPAVGINWKMFGNNGHINKPEGLVIENYTKRQSENNKISDYPQHVKSFVNPKKTVKKFLNPHYFLYDPMACFPYIPAAVNENYKVIDGNPFNEKINKGCRLAYSPEISYSIFSINHYWTRSKQEFMERKYGKPRDDTGKPRENAEKEFNDYNFISNEIEDKIAFRFAEKIKNIGF